MNRWGILWRSWNKLDGKHEHLIYVDNFPILFLTREKARRYIREEYSWLKNREDLQREPFGWKMPKAVKVNITCTDRKGYVHVGEAKCWICNGTGKVKTYEAITESNTESDWWGNKFTAL